MAWIKRERKVSRVRHSPTLDRKERQKVYNSAAWKKLSDLKRRSDPLCEVCLLKGAVRPGEDVHHLRSFTKMEGNERMDAVMDYENLITVCKVCHQELHHGILKGCHTMGELRKLLIRN